MTLRSERRDATRARLVAAAVKVFAKRGFHGATTREIAKRAGTTQGLLTYHFGSKEMLWRAAADRIFSTLRTRLAERLAPPAPADHRERARQAIQEYVRFSAEHPELFRFMVEEGRSGDRRMRWLVDTHLRPLYEEFVKPGASLVEGVDAVLLPHLYYAMAGAGSLIFAVAPECRLLTGLDPEADEAVERHATLVARLLVP